MASTAAPATEDKPASPANETVLRILVALSVSHMLNDIIQALLPAVYPLLKESFHLSFTQVGMITFVFQVTASLLQPVVGAYTDRRPQPFSLAMGMVLSLIGLVLLSRAGSFHGILVASALVGAGSSVFHPEASRLARLASGGKHGFAQSLFQVGGNFGTALGPLLASLVVQPYGQPYILWFSLLAIVGIFVLSRVGKWYRTALQNVHRRAQRGVEKPQLSTTRVVVAILVLLVLIFSKYFYLVSLTSYYTFYLIGKFGITVRHAQIFLFIFLFAVAAGTILGGPFGDRYGRKLIIWISILGVAPFSILLPHVGLVGTILLTVPIGIILASAFSAILVYAQELVPGKVGLVAGLFFGFAFGMAGIGSALLGSLADHTSINYVFHICSYLPLIGLLAAFLPNLETAVQRGK